MAILRSVARVQRQGAASTRRWASSAHHDSTPSDVYTKNSFNTPFFRFVAVTAVMAFGYYRFTVNDKASANQQFRTLLEEANAATTELDKKEKQQGGELDDEQDSRPFLTRYMEYHSLKPSEIKQYTSGVLKEALQYSQDRMLLDDYKPPSVKRLDSRAQLDIVNPNGRVPGTEVDTSDVVIKPRYIRRLLEEAEAEEAARQQ